MPLIMLCIMKNFQISKTVELLSAVKTASYGLFWAGITTAL